MSAAPKAAAASLKGLLAFVQPQPARPKRGRPRGVCKPNRWTSFFDVGLYVAMRFIMERDGHSDARRAANRLLADGFPQGRISGKSRKVWNAHSSSHVVGTGRYAPRTRSPGLTALVNSCQPADARLELRVGEVVMRRDTEASRTPLIEPMDHAETLRQRYSLVLKKRYARGSAPDADAADRQFKADCDFWLAVDRETSKCGNRLEAFARVPLPP